jgi:hypothetical protein
MTAEPTTATVVLTIANRQYQVAGFTLVEDNVTFNHLRTIADVLHQVAWVYEDTAEEMSGRHPR